MDERYEFLANKRLRIFSSNEKIRHLNEEASYKLNEKGCKLFDITLKTLENKREKLKIVGGDIEERFDDARIVTYESNITSCSCSTFASFQAPCVHIVFQRESENLADLIHPRRSLNRIYFTHGITETISYLKILEMLMMKSIMMTMLITLNQH